MMKNSKRRNSGKQNVYDNVKYAISNVFLLIMCIYNNLWQEFVRLGLHLAPNSHLRLQIDVCMQHEAYVCKLLRLSGEPCKVFRQVETIFNFRYVSHIGH